MLSFQLKLQMMKEQEEENHNGNNNSIKAEVCRTWEDAAVQRSDFLFTEIGNSLSPDDFSSPKTAPEQKSLAPDKEEPVLLRKPRYHHRRALRALEDEAVHGSDFLSSEIGILDIGRGNYSYMGNAPAQKLLVPDNEGPVLPNILYVPQIFSRILDYLPQNYWLRLRCISHSIRNCVHTKFAHVEYPKLRFNNQFSLERSKIEGERVESRLKEEKTNAYKWLSDLIPNAVSAPFCFTAQICMGGLPKLKEIDCITSLNSGTWDRTSLLRKELEMLMKASQKKMYASKFYCDSICSRASSIEVMRLEIMEPLSRNGTDFVEHITSNKIVFPKLKKLSLIGLDNNRNLDYDLFASFPGVENVKFLDGCSRSLNNAFPNLIRFSKLKAVTLPRHANILLRSPQSSNPGIEKIVFSGKFFSPTCQRQKSESDIKTLNWSKFFQEAQNLRILDISRVRLTSNFVEAIGKIPNLHTLKIFNIDISDIQSLRYKAEFLASLRILDLSLNIDLREELFTFLRYGAPNLEEVKIGLTGGEFKPWGGHHNRKPAPLLISLGDLNKITRLTLSLSFSYDQPIQLSASEEWKSRLKELRLMSFIEGFQFDTHFFLVVFLMGCSALEILDIRGTIIEEKEKFLCCVRELQLNDNKCRIHLS